MRLSRVLLASIAAYATGCAHVAFEATVRPTQGNATVELMREARRTAAEDLAEIQFVQGGLPPGLSFVEKELVSTDPSHYQVLGRVDVVGNPLPAMLSSHGVWFYRYEDQEAWRRGYCSVQVPLVWLTLGIWDLVPLHYPCVAAEQNNEAGMERREARIMIALARGTHVLGGNLLVLPEAPRVEIHGVTSPLTVGNIDTNQGHGFAVKDLTR